MVGIFVTSWRNLVLTFRLDADLKTEATSFNIIRRILSQVFEQSVGNVILYKLLCDAYDFQTRNQTTGLEDFLWRALEAALHKDGDREVMVVVDGLNHVAGGETGSNALFDRLHTACSKTSNMKCLILTRTPSKPFSKPARQFAIKDEQTHDDMHHYIHQALSVYHHFHDRNDEEKQQLVHRLADHAKGNYTFAELIIENLKKETTHNGFTQAFGSLPKSISEAIKRLVSRLDAAKSHDGLIVSWYVGCEYFQCQLCASFGVATRSCRHLLKRRLDKICSLALLQRLKRHANLGMCTGCLLLKGR